jgi:hypothetical protein
VKKQGIAPKSLAPRASTCGSLSFNPCGPRIKTTKQDLIRAGDAIGDVGAATTLVGIGLTFTPLAGFAPGVVVIGVMFGAASTAAYCMGGAVGDCVWGGATLGLGVLGGKVVSLFGKLANESVIHPRELTNLEKQVWSGDWLFALFELGGLQWH